MRFRAYFKLTKETTNNCLIICGVIFTTIYAIIAITTGYINKSLTDAIEIFILSFLLGNGLGIFIFLLAITTSYKQVKSIQKFYHSIPDSIKEKFGLKLIAKLQNPKYNYLQLEILDTKSEQPFLFNYDKKFVCITIMNDTSILSNFQKRTMEIHKKYKQEKIVLTGWGLKKNIKWKDWQSITDEKINGILEKLKEISNTEKLIIMNRVE